MGIAYGDGGWATARGNGSGHGFSVCIDNGDGACAAAAGLTSFTRPHFIQHPLEFEISPTQGPTTSGTTVTITALNTLFPVSDATENVVRFGGEPATDVVVATDFRTMTVKTPSGIGAVDVTIDTALGTTGTLAGAFVFNQDDPSGIADHAASGSGTATTGRRRSRPPGSPRPPTRRAKSHCRGPHPRMTYRGLPATPSIAPLFVFN